MTTNPTRNSYSFNNHHQIPISGHSNNEPFHIQVLRTTLTSLKFFLKKPHAFPFLLFIFLVLTWVSLRMQHHHSAPNFSQSSSDSLQLQQNKWSSTKMDEDRMANLVRFSSSGFPSVITKDKRGWLLNPISIALRADISGTAVTCTSVHVGEIRPGGMRGNHKHHTCNETFVIWGAATVFREGGMKNRSGGKVSAKWVPILAVSFFLLGMLFTNRWRIRQWAKVMLR